MGFPDYSEIYGLLLLLKNLGDDYPKLIKSKTFGEIFVKNFIELESVIEFIENLSESYDLLKNAGDSIEVLFTINSSYTVELTTEGVYFLIKRDLETGMEYPMESFNFEKAGDVIRVIKSFIEDFTKAPAEPNNRVSKNGGSLGNLSIKSKTTFSAPLPKVLNSITVEVPEHILRVCRNIEDAIPNVEFMIYVEVEEVDWENGRIKLGKKFGIPKQEVGYADVEQAEQLSEFPPSRSCVIHKHPNGSKTFSSTDEDDINRKYLVSILYVDRQLGADVVVNYFTKDGFIVRIPNVQVVIRDDQEPLVQKEELLEKINKKTYSSSKTGKGKKGKKEERSIL